MIQILLLGAGQIGSRHFEGLLKVKSNLEITVIDPQLKLLDELKLKLKTEKVKNLSNKSFFWQTGLQIKKKYDIAIIATSSKNRSELIYEISNQSKINFWVIEKVLAQSLGQMSIIKSSTSNALGAYVNTPRRIMPWYQEIKKNFYNNGPLHFLKLGGNWGLACNAIHYIDLIYWFTNENLISVSTNNLNNKWFKSKREGYFEINGKLEMVFSKGSRLELIDNSSRKNNSQIRISNQNETWYINEDSGKAYSNTNKVLKGKIIYQSDMTDGIINDILETKKSNLTSLDESISQHQVFLEAMLLHWNQVNNKNDSEVPIT